MSDKTEGSGDNLDAVSGSNNVDSGHVGDSVDAVSGSDNVDSGHVGDSVDAVSGSNNVDSGHVGDSVDAVSGSDNVDSGHVGDSVDAVPSGDSVDDVPSGDSVDAVSGSDNVDSGHVGDSVDAVPSGDSVDDVSRFDIAAAGDDTDARGIRKPSKEYAMNKPNRGVAIIINNVLFQPQTNLAERTGSDKDQAVLKQRFIELEFEVREYKNLTQDEMETLMKKVAGENHTNNDCFMCAMLSHGDKEIIYGVDGAIETELLFEPLKGDKCISLAGKPKIFFIQACRGSKSDSGIEILDEIGGRENCEIEVRIPTGADFLIAYSVVSGFVSYRNSVNGSWFVQAISEVLKEDGQEADLMTLMTRVNSIVAYSFERENTQEKQMPCITSTLTKAVYFKKKKSKKPHKLN